MTDEEVDTHIKALLDYHLALENGEMMMPLKPVDIDSLLCGIRDLIETAVREATR